MVDQGIRAFRLAVVQGLLQRIEHEVGAHGAADPPAHNAPGIHVDHERHVQPALPGRDVGEVRHPKLVGAICLEHPVDTVQRAWRLGIADRRAHDLATDDATLAESAHEPLDRAAGHGHALSVHLHPDLVSAVDLHVGVPDTLDIGNQFIVTLGACAA